jgi:non-heme chloroperoxidase
MDFRIHRLLAFLRCRLFVDQPKKGVLFGVGCLMLLASPIYAQEIAGNWQAKLQSDSEELRLFLQIAKNETGGWRAVILNLGKTDAIRVKSLVLQGSDLKIDIDTMKAAFEGKVNADGTVIDGTWTQEGKPQPLKFLRETKETEWQHTQYVTVDKDITLEVIDWGGSGRPVVLLAGLGNTAHILDPLAHKLTPVYHVYGITRRGFGISSTPELGYSADQLGDDVLAVIEKLKLDRPFLVGHSIAGEELSSIGSRHPEKVAGLIYLDAVSWHSFYGPSARDIDMISALRLDIDELVEKLTKLRETPVLADDSKALIEQMVKVDLPWVQQGLEMLLKLADEGKFKFPPRSEVPSPDPSSKIISGAQRYTEVKAPILAICASECNKQAKLLESCVPSARFVALRNANHYVFFSNEEDVLREMNAFIAGLH